MVQPDASTAPPATAEVVVARTDHSVVAISLDLPLNLTKAGRREEMVVRRALFLTSQVTQVRPASGNADRYRWKLAGYLQRQYCVRSLAGVFACTPSDVEALPDKAEGEALLTKAGDFSLAQAAEQQLTEALAARADALFKADRVASVAPLFKAAGVRIGGARLRAAPRR